MTPARKSRKKGHGTRQLTAPAHHRQGAQLLEMPYAIQYESYGSCPRESIDGPDASPLARLVAHVGAHGGVSAPGPAVALALGAGLALRLWMLGNLFDVNGDMLVYGDLAKNLLLHGRFALTLPSGAIYSTLIRLPGYPLFLALCFKIFGMENYFAVACVQIALDLLGCLLLAGFVRRIVPPRRESRRRAGYAWLAALCPFTASYTVAPLAETPTLFVLALAMWAMARFHDDPGWVNALWFTFAIVAAALLRPDGALAAVAFAPAIVYRSADGSAIDEQKTGPHGRGLRAAGADALCGVDGAQLARVSCD